MSAASRYRAIPTGSHDFPITMKDDELLAAEFDAFNRATAEVLEKSDRVRVVLLGAELDRILTMTLRRFLIPPDKITDILLDRESTFATRIELGYRIGLLNPDWVHDLRLINSIRDDFAHGQSGLHLESSPHREMCFQLKIGSKWSEINRSSPDGGNAPTRFVSTAVFLASNLLIIGSKTRRIEEHWRTFTHTFTVKGEFGDTQI